MGNYLCPPEAIALNYEDLQEIRKHPETRLINTLPDDMQSCLLLNTVMASKEEAVINQLLAQKQTTIVRMVIYGQHYQDHTVAKKYQQLTALGFTQVFVYLGGMFEWLLLQDIYGVFLFPTTNKETDLLKFKPPSRWH